MKANVRERMSPDIARELGGSSVQYSEKINVIKMNNGDENFGGDIYDVSDAVQVFVTAKKGTSNLRALLDTGALDGNYINIKASKHLKSRGINLAPSQVLVCTAVKNSQQCAPASNEVILNVEYKNELDNKNESLNETFTVIDSQHEMIIGRPTIRKYGLANKMPSQFSQTENTNSLSLIHI